MSELQELLGRVAFPDTPEDRDEAEIAIEALLDPEAWHEGYEAGYNKACQDIAGIKPDEPRNAG